MRLFDKMRGLTRMLLQFFLGICDSTRWCDVICRVRNSNYLFTGGKKASVSQKRNEHSRNSFGYFVAASTRTSYEKQNVPAWEPLADVALERVGLLRIVVERRDQSFQDQTGTYYWCFRQIGVGKRNVVAHKKIFFVGHLFDGVTCEHRLFGAENVAHGHVSAKNLHVARQLPPHQTYLLGATSRSQFGAHFLAFGAPRPRSPFVVVFSVAFNLQFRTALVVLVPEDVDPPPSKLALAVALRSCFEKDAFV